MKLLSVNVSLPREVSHRGRTVRTGIFKERVEGRVMLRTLNLEGDGQADLEVHGGADKAVYAYPIENYVYWKAELAREDLRYGHFGENFTVAGMLEDGVHVGDVFRIGDAVVQVTQPRVPCYKLALRMENPHFLKLFLASGRVGFYLKVLEEGEVGAGDAIERVEEDPERMSVRQAVRLLYFERTNVEGARRALRIPALSPGWRRSFEEIVDPAQDAAGADRGGRRVG
jgi:MOSC domain-containing protein YiiM